MSENLPIDNHIVADTARGPHWLTDPELVAPDRRFPRGDGGTVVPVSSNKLYYGDNLEILKSQIRDETVDLIYLDPPFKSGTNYNLLFQAAGLDAVGEQVEAFKDTWKWGDAAERAYDDVRNYGKLGLALSGIRRWLGDKNEMMAYLAMMAVRLVHMQHKLKPSGSIFLHCDPVASHYLKILLDALFGPRSFQNEIIWSYRRWPTKASRLQRMHDVILFYSIDPEQAKFHVRYQGPTESSIKRWKGKKQNVTFDLLGQRNPTAELSEESIGVPLNDVWSIPVIAPVSKERMGYPTQKPLKLLEQIIDIASNEGDLVLDPFCGCGTAVDAAEMLRRQWIGIDIAHYAVTLIEERLARWRAGAVYEVYGRPTTLAGARDLAIRDRFQFEWWTAWLLGAQSYQKKGADQGIDGRIAYKNGPYGDGLIIISVKSGDNVGVQMVRDLRGVIEREEAEMGILVTLADPTQPMITEAARGGFVSKSAHGRLPRLQIVTIEEILEGKLPQMPPIPRPASELIPRRKKTSRDQLELLMPVAVEEAPAVKGDFIDPRFMRFGASEKKKRGKGAA